ncbi:YcxB family protein [Sporolactobacillus shoreae]|uniref:YcxB family protein n=1 Tax=Sporolactobacillus shoreae TaxID=1465501 RepID=A0A4Z0GIW3_9BACL|nr:YcxB family protein [Sporolactobacillus shoreae]TGA96740.1 YcxB family protein [Sporolactobacillus shoreae]
MELHYQVAKEDYIAFNLFTFEQSISNKRLIRTQKLFSLIFLLAPLVFSLLVHEFQTGYFVISLIIAALWIAFSAKIFRWSFHRRLSKMIDEMGKGKLCGETALILTDKNVIEIMPSGEETKAEWSSINKVAETDEYFFIYFNPMAAVILPKRALDDESIKVLKETIPSGVCWENE